MTAEITKQRKIVKGVPQRAPSLGSFSEFAMSNTSSDTEIDRVLAWAKSYADKPFITPTTLSEDTRCYVCTQGYKLYGRKEGNVWHYFLNTNEF